MTRPPKSPARSPQALTALLGAFVVLVIGIALLVVLVIGLLDGIRGTGTIILGLLTLGVFGLAARLVHVALTLRTGAQAQAAPAAARASRPSGSVRAPGRPPAQMPRATSRPRPRPR